MTVVPFSRKSPRLAEINSHLRKTFARVKRDITSMQEWIKQAREECRRVRRSFDNWARSGECGIDAARPVGPVAPRFAYQLRRVPVPSRKGFQLADRGIRDADIHQPHVRRWYRCVRPQKHRGVQKGQIRPDRAAIERNGSDCAPALCGCCRLRCGHSQLAFTLRWLLDQPETGTSTAAVHLARPRS
jgi:hypothetical protein